MKTPDTPDTPKTPRRNALSFPKRVELANYLNQNKEEFHIERPTYSAVATQAAEELGFTITQGNVGNLARELGIAWNAKRQAKTVRNDRLLIRLVAQTLLETLDDIRRLTTTPQLADKCQQRMEPLRSALGAMDAALEGTNGVKALAGATGGNPLEGQMETDNG